MTITLELSPEQEQRLRETAFRRGLTAEQLAAALVDSGLAAAAEPPAPNGAWPDGQEPLAIRLARMQPEERASILTAAAERAAPLYEADLARPWDERELTAFSEFDEPVHEH
ncbi:MAG TPA: hypothetical protein VFJ58_06190 [Armatimonadota bacterium]|nr:hypothetical protein [Armatimonadota bacterium]